MSGWIRIGLALTASAAILAISLAILYRRELQRPVGSPPGLAIGEAGGPSARDLRDPARFVRVRPGASLRSVLADLERHGWIRRPWVLRLEARRRGWDRRLIPGWYRRRPEETTGALLARLARGEFEESRVTIPEGWRLERILGVLADSAWVPRAAFDSLAGDPDWLRARGVPGPGLEGYLFPDTYRIPKGTEPDRLLETLLAPGRAYWTDSLASDAARLGWGPREVWTLASIIEAEAAAPPERARISAVFHNRLRLGMRLEADPTVLFALGRPPGRVLYADLEVDSAYNTYRRAGLPPGPICSPGRAALRAAVRPEPDCDALFFVARGDGTHVFSRTLAEHNRSRRARGSPG